jgi:hypothetical protein
MVCSRVPRTNLINASLTVPQFWYLCELLYVIANCLLKFSVGYFYLRVAVQKWHIWCIRLLQLGTVLFGLIYFFLVMLQCLPSMFSPSHHQIC